MPVGSRIIGAALLGGSATYYVKRAHHQLRLDSSSGSQPSSSSSSSPPSSPWKPTRPTPQLSAYETKEDPMYLVPEPASQLQRNIKKARTYVTDRFRRADEVMRGTVDHIIMFERTAERTLKQLRPRDEALMPGALYVGVSTLFSSILTRNRALPIRFLTPVLFFVGSGKLFLPHLTRNVGDFAYAQEARVPEVRRVHDQLRGQVARGLWVAGQKVEDAEHFVDGAVENTRSAFERTSGLKVSSKD